MPRHPDPDLENRILYAAQSLWRRGGEKSLTMRAVARAAGTNTPAVYRRFKNRQDLLRALIRRIAGEIRTQFELGGTLEKMAESYVEYGLRVPHDYELFYSHIHQVLPPKGAGRLRPIGDSRPNFAFVQQELTKRFGGTMEDYTHLTLALWATLHGTTMLLLSKSIPTGHEEELRKACRAAVKVLLDGAGRFSKHR